MNIEKKIVLVTGGANGIGFAYATEFLRNGAAHVAVLDLANSNGEEAVSKLNGEFGPGRAIFVICDVTKTKELEDGFAKTVKEFGGLDIVINNAGIMDDSRWELMININYNAVVRGTLLGLQYMGKDKGGKGGTIVNISSLVGIVPVAIFPIYTGTKHAVVGLSRSFGLPYHYEKTGVRVLTMCPSVTDTQLISKSAGRSLDIIKPEDVTEGVKLYPLQTVDSVAQGMMHMIRVGESASVWFVQGDEPIYEVEVPNAPTAVVRGTLLGLQHMGKDRGGKGGVIVNVASVAGVTPVASFPVYVGTKHAVIGLSRSFAMPYHYEKTGVRVLTMCPGITKTDLTSTASPLQIIDPTLVADEAKSFPFQKVEDVPQSMIFIIRSAQNGSIWIAEGGEPVYEISIPDRFSMKVPT